MAFPGLLVGKRDRNPESAEAHVVVVRDGQRTVLTIASTYQGRDADLAVVLPVPSPATSRQVNIADPGLLERLIAYSAPRLVEMKDADPCQLPATPALPSPSATPPSPSAPPAVVHVRGILDDAAWTDGEVSTEILAGEAARQPVRWLQKHGYKIPRGAEQRLRPFVKNHMAFVIAQYKLDAAAASLHHLRPLQVAYESPLLTLPLVGGGTATGRQVLHLYGLTRSGRLEAERPATGRLPAAVDLPEVVLHEPQRFYAAMTSKLAPVPSAFLELAWDGHWCDPCVADPLAPEDLHRLGAYWVDRNARPPKNAQRTAMQAVASTRVQDVFVTRLLLTWNGSALKNDPTLQVSADRNDLQVRFTVRTPFPTPGGCDAAGAYQQGLSARHEAEVQALAKLTGWDANNIRRALNLRAPSGASWIEDLWKD